MKASIIYFVFLITNCLVTPIFAQVYCLPILQKADSLYQAGLYKPALTELQKAGNCDFENYFKPKRDSLQIDIFDAIEKQKKEAEDARDNEKEAKDRANKSAITEKEAKEIAINLRILADSQRVQADTARKIAVRERANAVNKEKIATQKSLEAQARFFALESNQEREKQRYLDALCLAFSALTIGGDSLEVDIPFHIFGDAFYKLPNSVYIKTIGEQQLSKELIQLKLVPGKNQIITINRDNICRLWDFEGKLINSLLIDAKFVLDLAIDPNGNFAAISNDDGSIILWNLLTFEPKKLTGHTAEVLGIVFNPNGNNFISWSRDNSAILWNIAGYQDTVFNHSASIYQAAFSPDGKKISTRSADWTVKIWKISGENIETISHQSYVHFAAFSPNSQKLISCSSDGSAKLWDSKGSLITLAHPNTVVHASFSPDSTGILTRSLNNQLKLWNISGAFFKNISHHELVTFAKFAPDGKALYSGAMDGATKISSLQEEDAILLGTPNAKLLSIQNSTDGKLLLTQSKNSTSILWNNKGERLMTLNHKGLVKPIMTPSSNYIIISPDGIKIQIFRNPVLVFEEMKANSICP